MRLGPVLVVLLLGAPAMALAGATAPMLVLSAASGDGTPGAHTAVLEGAYEFNNAVQVGYPLHVVVFQKPRFVRYPITGAPVAGTSPVLNDGVLSEAEVPSLLGAGTQVPASVRIVTFAPDSIRVTLPSSFKSGGATAILFTILPEGTVLSNQIDFVLP